MIICGDCLEVMRGMDANSIDAIVTDPPYGLTQNKNGGSGAASLNLASPAGRSRITTGGGFMGQKWDAGVPCVDVWAEALRVAKPGAHLLAFGGTRTFHRLACAIEDAGWEIRDCLGWLYGSGFPKSHNLKGDHEGWGTALKPAWEPIIMARKPLDGTVAANVLKWGTGAINVGGCRVPCDGKTKFPVGDYGDRGLYGAPGNRTDDPNKTGRWPANLLHDGSDEVLELFPDRKTTWISPAHKNNRGGSFLAELGHPGDQGFNDRGPAARFFYCAKASRKEREMGMGEIPSRPLHWSSGHQNPGSFQSPNTDRTARNHHPTVKPLALMRYLCRLVTPPNGLILDPFMGSGTTLIAAGQEGFRAVGIEVSEEYCEIAKRRIFGSPAAAPDMRG